MFPRIKLRWFTLGRRPTEATPCASYPAATPSTCPHAGEADLDQGISVPSRLLHREVTLLSLVINKHFVGQCLEIRQKLSHSSSNFYHFIIHICYRLKVCVPANVYVETESSVHCGGGAMGRR